MLVADWIEQLASPVELKKRDPWSGDPYEHPQVASARARLISLGPPIFSELVKHRDDKRYSCTRSYSVLVDHSVGEVVEQIMEEVACGRFRGYGYKSRRNPRGTNMQPTFGLYLQEEFGGAENYAEYAKTLTRDQTEKEYIEWHLRRERSRGFVDAEQEREIVTPCLRRLAEL